MLCIFSCRQWSHQKIMMVIFFPFQLHLLHLLCLIILGRTTSTMLNRILIIYFLWVRILLTSCKAEICLFQHHFRKIVLLSIKFWLEVIFFPKLSRWHCMSFFWGGRCQVYCLAVCPFFFQLLFNNFFAWFSMALLYAQF